MKIFLYISNIIIISLPKIIFSSQNCYEYSCEECSSPDYGACTKCRESFRLLDGKCPCGFSSCSLCTSGLGGLQLCYVCREGYTHKEEDECICDIDYCEICGLNSCIKCITGYYYNSTLNACLEQNEEDKITCFDSNCDACFSEEKVACKCCKDGYYEKKGECLQLDLPVNNHCDNDHYLKGNYCYKKCYGVDCTESPNYYEGKRLYYCKNNHCLVCLENQLRIISECDNTKECSLLEGCLNCIDNEECLICMQGYFMLGGICKKCIEGCSMCENQHSCEYCLSGYVLTEEKKCNFSNNFDYNETSYNKIKEELIIERNNEEIENQSSTIPLIALTNIITTIPFTTSPTSIIKTNENQNIIKCDNNCIKCNTKTGICSNCKSSYVLSNNKCIKNTNPTTKPKILNTISLIKVEPVFETSLPKTYFSYIVPETKKECNIENCLKCSLLNNK